MNPLELKRLEEAHERVLASGSITNQIKCPRCGSTEVSYAGGDTGGLGDYYDMYICEKCGRIRDYKGKETGVQVFLVPISKEMYLIHPMNRGIRGIRS